MYESLGNNRWKCVNCANEVVCATAMTSRSCTKCEPQPKATLNKKERAVRTPTILQQAWSYLDATKLWRANGAQKVSEEQYAERKSICEGCEHLETIASLKRCGLCKCFIAAKAARITKPGESDCPIALWPVLGEIGDKVAKPNCGGCNKNKKKEDNGTES